MENYILILLTVLIVLVIAIVGFGYRKIEHLRTNVNKNTANINALQSYVSRIETNQSNFGQRSLGASNIDVSDSETETDFSMPDSFNLSPNKSKYSSESSSENDSTGESIGGGSIENYERVVELDKDEASGSSVNGSPTSSLSVDGSSVDGSSVDGSIVDKMIEEVVDGVINDFDNDNVKNVALENVVVKKQPKKRVPTDEAKNYDAGYKKESDNDGNEYIVIEMKNGIKRWKKVEK